MTCYNRREGEAQCLDLRARGFGVSLEGHGVHHFQAAPSDFPACQGDLA